MWGVGALHFACVRGAELRVGWGPVLSCPSVGRSWVVVVGLRGLLPLPLGGWHMAVPGARDRGPCLLCETVGGSGRLGPHQAVT